MAKRSAIEWTETTWNPVTGCTKVSQGCKYCYTAAMAKRLHAMGSPRYADGFKLTLQPDLLDLPKKWKKPRLIFVNSMSDLFHPDVPLDYIQQVFQTMKDCPQHTFQILTKRAERLVDLSDYLPWPHNVWMGVTVENSQVCFRSEMLRNVPVHVRFLSVEPMIGRIQTLPLKDIDWVIVGGESGPKSRPIEEAWIVEVRDQCEISGVAFFFKQWGGVQKHRNGRILQGRTYDAIPAH